MTTETGFPGLRTNPTPSETARVVNRINRGKVNAGASVTLAAGAATTVVSWPGIWDGARVFLFPTTANGAAELGAGTAYHSATSVANQTFTLTHANNAQTDRTFNVLVMGA